jgi:LAO/AO transport system kinase
LTGQGVSELKQAIADHRQYLHESGGWAERERARAASELDCLLRDQLMAHVLERIGATALDQAVERIVTRQLDAHSAVAALLADAGLT